MKWIAKILVQQIAVRDLVTGSLSAPGWFLVSFHLFTVSSRRTVLEKMLNTSLVSGSSISGLSLFSLYTSLLSSYSSYILSFFYILRTKN